MFCSCLHVTLGDDKVYEDDLSTASLVVPSVSQSRHSTIDLQEPRVKSATTHCMTPCSRPNLDSDESDTGEEVIKQVIHNETMRQGALPGASEG